MQSSGATEGFYSTFSTYTVVLLKSHKDACLKLVKLPFNVLYVLVLCLMSQRKGAENTVLLLKTADDTLLLFRSPEL